jgi:hypothetical protein
VERFKSVIESLGEIPDNVWAFLLFVLACGLAVAGHFGHDKELLGFAGTIAMTGAALFHGKEKKSSA